MHRFSFFQRTSLAAAAFALISFSSASASEFSLTNVALPGVGHSSVICGDLTNHRKTDVLLTGSDGSFTGICQLWQNGTNGAFTNLTSSFPGLSSSSAARGDFDNDGMADLLLTGFAGVDSNSFPVYVSQIWRNLGNGTFTNIQAGLPGVDTGAVGLGDFDNDGYLDVLLTGYSATGAVAQVWRNLGNGTFTNIQAGLPGLFYSAAAWGDYDRDGLPDILLTGTANGFVNTAVAQVWRNLGNGTFSNLVAALPGVFQGAAAWGDFDQDGWLDILLTGVSATGAVSQVWRNTGSGTFTNVNAGLPGVYQSSVALGDYDNDGRLDIALAGETAQTNLTCNVWRNEGNGVFTNLNAGLPGIRAGSLAWADFDNDGRLDLLLTGLYTNGAAGLQLYHNNTSLVSTSAPLFKSARNLGAGTRELTFHGDVGFGYTVWTSTNLTQWTALGTPNEGSPATLTFVDGATTNIVCRTYRVSRP